jgi:hypothetical protein
MHVSQLSAYGWPAFSLSATTDSGVIRLLS